jgi:beta-lactamase regulating signal transducer with metallopeptidase domain
MLMSWLFVRLSADGAGLLPALIDATFKGIAILSLAALATFAMRRRSAAARHLVWFLGTFSLLMLPILSVALPACHVLPSWIISDAVSTPPVTTSTAASVQDSKLIPSDGPVRVEPQVSTSTQPPVSLPTYYFGLNWQALVLLVWLAGSGWYLGCVLMGHISLWRLQRASSPITNRSLSVLLSQLCDQLRFHRPAKLLSSPCRAMPMTWGLWRTRLLLPEDSMDWTAEQLRVVMLHELAHAKRFDCLTQLVAQITCALHWFNPLAWLALRQMQTERELACDDLVLIAGTKASTYAEQLLQIATETVAIRFSAAAIGMARPSKLEGRLRAILDTSRDRGSLRLKNAVLISLVVGVSVVVLATLRADDTAASPELQSVSRWAARYGWKAQQVAPTTLESKPGAWRNLPFSLGKDEEAAALACIKLARTNQFWKNGKSEFSDPATRVALESILKKHPDYFYAEFLLSQWHRNFGDRRQGAQLLDAAYQHAPVIIVQRFAFADGTPLADTPISTFALECNRVQNSYLDPSLTLLYCNLRTDADGCIYLPVYDTVYRTNDMAYPGGYAVTFPRLGWFETSRKVALLPVATVALEISGTP